MGDRMKIIYVLTLTLLALFILGCTTGKAVDTAVPTQTATACQDTDGGLNLLVAGSASGLNENGNPIEAINDNCLNTLGVNEYYCSNGVLKTIVLDCPSGSQCAEGKCVFTETVKETTVTGASISTGGVSKTIKLNPDSTDKKAYGTLNLGSTPSGADIYLDDVLIGTTPSGSNLLVQNVPVGKRQLVFKKDKYNDRTFTIYVSNLQTYAKPVLTQKKP